VDHTLVHGRIDDRSSFFQLGGRFFLVTRVDGADDTLDRGAQLGPRRHIARTALHGLTGTLLG